LVGLEWALALGWNRRHEGMDVTENGVESMERSEAAVVKKRMQPGACRAYIRRRLASEFVGIVDGL
jgi:hypothetical protein